MGGFVFIRSLNGGNVVPYLRPVLSRMEFRGKDCSGIAWLEGGRLSTVKDSCPINELFNKYPLASIHSDRVLGHTRYSTHGKADPRNAHPHLDCEGSVAVVGDGALRNYEELQAELIEGGHRIASKSDFEVISHIVEELVKRGSSFVGAFSEAIARAQGMFSAAALCKDGTAAAYTSHQPIYVGLGKDLLVISSTLSGLHGLVGMFSRIDRGEYVVVTREGRLAFVDRDGNTITKNFVEYALEEQLVEADGFPHHMLREIYETPYSILRTASAIQIRYLELASKTILRSSRVFVIANGTSLHAGLVFSYYLSELSGRVPLVVSASEFPLYYLDNVGVGDVIVAISQSGETPEVILSTYEARLRGATVIGITNNINSRLTRFSNIYLPIASGPEIAVPATKTFASTLTLLYVIARTVGSLSTKMLPEVLDGIWGELEKLHTALLESIDRINLEARESSEILGSCSSGYVVSRGIAYPLALEGALKIKESAYIHAEGIEGGELRHGPISVLDKNTFVIFIEPLEDTAARDMLKVVKEVLDYGSPVVLISHTWRENLGLEIRVPKTERHFMPITITLAVQLLAYWLSRRRGVDVDKPRRLAKVVRT